MILNLYAWMGGRREISHSILGSFISVKRNRPKLETLSLQRRDGMN